MSALQKLFKNPAEIVILLMMVFYISLGSPMSRDLARFVNSMEGVIVIVLLCTILLSMTNPAIGVLSIIIAFQLLQTASEIVRHGHVNHFFPSEQKKYTALNNYNQFPYTLEQSVVAKMAPLCTKDLGKPMFKPTLESVHDATSLSSM